MAGCGVGVGVIGLGVGERHAIAFDRHPDCRLAALCDADNEKLASVSRRYPDCRLYRDADELIADPDVAIVAVASPDDVHHWHIAAALRAGKHVFAEKPLVIRIEHAREIRALLRRNTNLRLTTNTILRMSPRFRALRNDIAAGCLGQLYFVEADYNYGRLHKLSEGWRGRIPDYSVMLGGGIHMIDLVLWLTGERVVEVVAMGGDIVSRGIGFPNPDLTVALLRLEGGGLAKVAANFGCVEPHFHRLTVYGTAATFENGRDHALVWESRKPSQQARRVETAYPGMDKGDMIPAFVNAVTGRGEPEVDENAVFAALSVAFAVDKAQKMRRPVTVDYI